MRDDHLWAAVKITEAAVTQLFNGASTPNEVRRGLQIGEIVAELYTAISAGIVEADYRVGRIAAADSSDQETQPNAPILESKPPESKPPESKPPESKPPESKPPESKPPESKPPESKPPESKPPESKPPESKPPESKPPESKPPESKPPESKPPESKPPESKPPESKPPQTAGFQNHCRIPKPLRLPKGEDWLLPFRA